MKRQRGVALITAMLVVAIATIMAVQLMGRQLYDIRRTQNILERDQSYSYALAAEAWAREILIATRRDEDDAVDHLNEPWAQPITPPAFEGVELAIQLEDLQGRLNINNLITLEGQDNEAEMARFQRLLEHLQMDGSLLPAVMDWLDLDVEERFPGGAEDDFYTRLETPYRPANQPMASISELRLIRDVDDQAYRQLAPVLTALPAFTPINVNTASARALRTIADGLSEAEVQALIEAVPDEGYASVEEFLQAGVLAGREVPEQGLSVGSNWFLLRVEVRLGRTALRTESVIYRGDAGNSRTILRRQGFLDHQPIGRASND
ncbi:MAG: type II secretion system minor pseudopilin GspK [Aquisalimonadaceae bacterium]